MWDEGRYTNSLSSSSSTVIGIEHCMKTLELSYKCLPVYLKPCFLYFGGFQEDKEIPVRTLLWLWSSEGFVQNSKAKSSEEVANEYLMDLTDRSLVMVVRQKSIGGAKTCRIHDLLHEFCMAKAKEESFLQILRGFNRFYTSSRPYNTHRLCIFYDMGEEAEIPRVYFPHLRSLLLFSKEKPQKWPIIFKLLRVLVLDIKDIYRVYEYFPREVELLVHLRYLCFACNPRYIPSGMANLSRLETFVIVGSSRVVRLPDTIWNMRKLRQLCCVGFKGSDVGFIFPTDGLDVSPDLHHLETCTLYIDCSSESLQKIIKKFPSICRLKISIEAEVGAGHIDLGCLDRLKSLKTTTLAPSEICFPLNLKKLTLSNNQKPWSEISTIRKLPNLEVLKLLYNSIVGKIWEMEEEQFPHLRFLKLEDLDLCRWIASSDNFPRLEKLVLDWCHRLEGVPSSLGDIPTLEMIEVRYCSKSATKSVQTIQEEQKDMGNESLKIQITF